MVLSDRYRRRYVRVSMIIFYAKILVAKVKQACRLTLYAQLRQGSWATSQLQFCLLDVVAVQVYVATRPHKLADS